MAGIELSKQEAEDTARAVKHAVETIQDARELLEDEAEIAESQQFEERLEELWSRYRGVYHRAFAEKPVAEFRDPLRAEARVCIQRALDAVLECPSTALGDKELEFGVDDIQVALEGMLERVSAE